MSQWFELLDSPEVLVFSIPLAVIVIGGVVAIVGMILKHRERMHMIEHGIHPDSAPDEDDD